MKPEEARSEHVLCVNRLRLWSGLGIICLVKVNKYLYTIMVTTLHKIHFTLPLSCETRET